MDEGRTTPEPLPIFEASAAEGATCALSDDALRERLESLGRLGAANLLESRAEGARHLLVFRADPEMRAALEAVIAAESECCSVLELAIEEEERGTAQESRPGRDPDRLVLTVAAPPEGALLAAGFAAAFGA